jgi:UDP-N-acetylglucosamine--N-acetylmuramyl-(pentapeptide) pyrophosphoryl-undecaprenol N-acetylglucosamine transferase
MANSLGARRAAGVGVAFEGTPIRGGRVVGMPLRREIVDLDRPALRGEAAAYFGLDAARPTLLVFGGSLGAQRLNEAFGGAWRDVLEAGWQLVHVTGERSTLPDPGAPGYAMRRYIDRMDLAFALCDLIVSRAGAATVSEISALGIPAVYVPYAVGNGEQALNAASAVRAGAAILIPDAEFTADRVRSEIVPLLADEHRRAAMADAAASVGTRNGTENVVEMIDEALEARP